MKSKKLFILIISLSTILISCNQSPKQKMAGIWEFKKEIAKTYIIKDSIPQALKDSIIAIQKEKDNTFEMSYLFEIDDLEAREGYWEEDAEKYYVDNRSNKYRVDTITAYTDFELMHTMLEMDTLYRFWSPNHNFMSATLEYVNENQLNKYDITHYSEDFGQATLIVITPLTRFTDKKKIEYFNPSRE